jgi:hypothetical protein
MFENLIECLEYWGERIAAEYKDKLNNEGITASGKLANSIKCLPVDVNGNIYEVSLQLEEYWKAIEDGRAPTKNSGNGELRRAILKWITAKPVIKRPYNGKLPTDEQLAFLISRKIHREGYKGRQPLQRTIDELRDDILADIKEAVEKDLSEEVIVMLRTIEIK